MNKLDNIFNGVSIEVIKDSTLEITNNQNTLFHYTSSEGAIGIIEKRELWFSDIRFLNDGSELLYGIYRVMQELQKYCIEKKVLNDDFIKKIQHYLFAISSSFISVVACFSSEGNLLNQWRNYGKSSVSYALEIEWRKLLSAETTFPVHLVRMIYEEKEVESMCRKLFSEIHKRIEINIDKISSDPGLEDELIIAAAREMIWISMSFKHPSFLAEKEWRLVAFLNEVGRNPSIRSHRAGALGIVPYYKFSYVDKSSLPIVGMRVGPTPHENIAKIATNGFLRANNYNFDATSSEIPIRY